MKIINSFMLIFIIKLAYSVQYIDLKNNFISEEIHVFYGRFMEYGSYKMFCGSNASLELVYYGHIKIFPQTDYVASNHTLLVELYKIGDKKIINLFDFYKIGDILHRSENIQYEIGEYGFNRINKKRMEEIIKGPIFISVDISKNESHPFVYPKCEKYRGSWVLTYTMRKAFFGMELGRKHTREYFLGRIYDSKRPIYIGFSEISEFVERCSSFKVKRS